MPYTGNRSSSPKVTVSSIIYKKIFLFYKKIPTMTMKIIHIRIILHFMPTLMSQFHKEAFNSSPAMHNLEFYSELEHSVS